MVWNPPIITVPEIQIRINARENSGAYLSNLVGQIELDNTAPTVSIQSFTGGQLVAGNSVQTLNYTASDAHMGLVDIYTSSDSGANWNLLQMNLMNTGSVSVTIPTNDLSTNRFRVIAKDILGNSLNADGGDFTIDSTAPMVTISAPVGGEAVAGGQTLTINYAATDPHILATPISIDYSIDNGTTWVPIVTNGANAGSYAWTTPALNSAAMKVRVRALDLLALQGTQASNGNFIVDSTPPSFTAGEMKINGGQPNIANAIAPVAFASSDALTPVTHFCLKLDSSTPPTPNDSCWILGSAPPLNIPTSQNLAVANYGYNFGYFNTTHTLYAFARDRVGNISELSNGGVGTDARDRAAITIGIDAPPVVNNVIVANTTSHADPPTKAEKTVSGGSTVFIKWDAVDTSFGATPIRLDYTSDDGSTYTLISNNLVNGVNGACSVNAALPLSDDTMTGCYAWTFPNFGLVNVRVRVTATDSSSQTHTFLSEALNSQSEMVAGRLDSGIGGDARRALLIPDLSDEFEGDPDILAVKANGDMFFRDRVRGLIYISATTRLAQLLIPMTGTISGDGGPVSSATLRNPLKIAIDANGDVLVFDYDRIRKIVTSTSPKTITTIIGGGSDTNDIVGNPTNVLIEPPSALSSYAARYMPFFALPNGRIYFQSRKFGYQSTQAEGARIRYFDPNDGAVKTLFYSGVGTDMNPSADISACAFKSYSVAYDPNTSQETKRILWTNYVNGTCSTGAGFSSLDEAGATAVPHPTNPAGQTHYGYLKTAQDGALYYTSKFSARIFRYNVSTNTWTTLAGTGASGSCNDGTVATSCNIRVHDVAVTRQGQVFFVDLGRIRTIDSTNRIRTIYGTSLEDVQENVFATSTLVGPFDTFARTSSGQIKLLDKGARRFRSVSENGFITTAAGNGIYVGNTIAVGTATSNPLPSQTNYYPNFGMDASTGDIFYGDDQYILKLTAATGMWSRVVGGGATAYQSADGQIGANVSLNATGALPHRVLAVDGSNVIVAKNRYVANYVDAMIKSYDSSAGFLQTSVAGVTGGAGVVFGSDGTLPNSLAVPTASYVNYYATPQSTNLNHYFMVPNTNRIVQIPKTLLAVSTLKSLPETAKSFYYDNQNSRIFFCNALGQLRSVPVSAGSVTNYPLPLGSTCAGTTLLYKDGAVYVPVTKDKITYGLLRYPIP